MMGWPGTRVGGAWILPTGLQGKEEHRLARSTSNTRRNLEVRAVCWEGL